MVAIAQLVEPWIVIPVVASSNLVSHPILSLQNNGSFGFQCRLIIPKSWGKISRWIAQLGSASGLGPEGRGFESLFTDHIKKAHQKWWAFFLSGEKIMVYSGLEPSRIKSFFTDHLKKRQSKGWAFLHLSHRKLFHFLISNWLIPISRVAPLQSSALYIKHPS